VIKLEICVVTSPRIYKPSLCGALLRMVTIVLIYYMMNLCGLLLKLVREFYKDCSPSSSEFVIGNAKILYFMVVRRRLVF